MPAVWIVAPVVISTLRFPTDACITQATKDRISPLQVAKSLMPRFGALSRQEL